MRMQRIILTCAFSILAAGAASSQEYRGTMEQQMACTPDVWRLCSAQIPDVNSIVACLRSNTAQLSNGCRAVFEANNAPTDTARAAPQGQPRGRVAPAQRPQAVRPQPSNPWYDND